MPVIRPQSLGPLLALQANIVSREQALEHGKTRNVIATLLRTERWRAVYPGVYYTIPGIVPRKAHLWAAVLKVGPGAVLSHETAAEVWGISDERSAVVHVSVPRARGTLAVPPRVRLHYSSRLPEAEFPAASGYKMPPVTWPHEAVYDLASSAATAEEAVAWAIKACQRRATDPEMIGICLQKPGHRRLKWRDDLIAALADIRAGVQSPLEFRYLRDVERAHYLPEGKRQVKTKRGSQVQFHDVRYVEYGVCVELDGARWHSGETKARDAARDNTSTLDGFRTLRYGWLQVAYHPCEVAHEVWSLLAQQGYRADFRPCARPCAPPDCARLTVEALLA